MPSRAEIQCVCAFTYMNARSRQNLSDTWTDVMNRARSGRRAGGALDSVIGMALARRTTATCMRGVSDPLRAGRGAKQGAAKWARDRWRGSTLTRVPAYRGVTGLLRWRARPRTGSQPPSPVS